jgi:hypothetical protein
MSVLLISQLNLHIANGSGREGARLELNLAEDGPDLLEYS